MSADTKIQWTNHTFNGWWGCTKVGPGCDHCYAEAFDKRTAGGGHWGAGVPRRALSDKNWNEPRRWDRAAAMFGHSPWVFCGSMMDWADNEVPDEWRARLFATVTDCRHLRWQMLTKRIGNALKMLPAFFPIGFDHVGFMATMVTQAEFERDMPKLREVKRAGARWVGVSIEPLLERVDIERGSLLDDPWLDWVIVGGESGAGARPFDIDWALGLIGQCRRLNIPVFVKQLGARPVVDGSPIILSDRKGGDIEEWPAGLRVREFPRVFDATTPPGGVK